MSESVNWEFTPIFLETEFNITPEDIPDAREKVQREFRSSQSNQTEGNSPGAQTYGAGSEAITRDRAMYWARYSDEEIFEMARAFYGEGKSLEDSGVSEEEVTRKLRDDPRILLEPLFRDEIWGRKIEDARAKLSRKEFLESSEE